MSIIAQFYPNGEFTQGVDTSRRRRSRLDRLSDKSIAERAPSLRRDINTQICAEIQQDSVPIGALIVSAQRWRYTYLGRENLTYWYAVEHPDNEWEPYVTDLPYHPLRWSHLVGAAHIGLSDGRIFKNAQNPDSSVSRKKCLSMSKSMARNIRNAGFLLQELYGKDQLSFLTLTLPNVSIESINNISLNWGKIVNHFLTWLGQKMKSASVPFEYVYCTEIQEKRRTKYGQTAFHLHMVFVGRNRRQVWAVTPIQCRKAWVRAIKPYCAEDQFETSALENLQKVKSSASGYLSKYLSKGTRADNASGADPALSGLVIHWGGMARLSRQRIKVAIRRFDSSTGNAAFVRDLVGGYQYCCELQVIRYVRTGFIQTNGFEKGEEPRGIFVSVGCLGCPSIYGGIEKLAKALGHYAYPFSVSDKWKHVKMVKGKAVVDL